MDSRATHLRGGLINIQSVSNKTIQIREMINDRAFDIVALIETWLMESDSAKINEMTPFTHTFHHIPREGKRGGGVGLFASKALTHLRVQKRIEVESFEYMEVIFKCSGQWILCLVVYRPPGPSVNNFIEKFRNLLDLIDMVSLKVVIMGDFNIRMDDPTHHDTIAFNELLEEYQLMNNVKNSTSRAGHMLDLIIGDVSNNIIESVEVESEFDISPVHKFISFDLCLPNSKVFKNISFRSKTDFSPESFIREITRRISNELDSPCTHSDLNHKIDCVNCLTDSYNQISKTEYNDRCPYMEKCIVIKDRSPWFNGETMQKKREKRRKERKWLKNKTASAWEEYKNVKNQYNALLKSRKAEYYNKKIQEAGSDMNKLYQVLNNLTGSVRKKRLPDGFDDRVLAENFCEFFKNKIENLVSGFAVPLPPDEIESATTSRLECFKTINKEDLSRIIGKAKKTHCAVDPIPIAEVAGADNFSDLIDVLLTIVNTSISTCQYPESEKLAIINPILKSGLDYQSLSSFRPVSNLSFLSKILEYVILEQLMDHLNKVHALPDNQSAYRQLYSTETAVCAVVSDLLDVMDEGKCAILVLLDLSAAFDTVVHELLLNDMKTIGIEQVALQYLENYLRDRKYCVQIGNSFSSHESLTRGVPQGSVLGPILFCIYTIGLSNVLQEQGVKFKLFADDTQLYLSVSDINNTTEKLNSVLQSVKEWMDLKHLKLNENKTEYMLVGKRDNLSNLGNTDMYINGDQVHVAERVRDLGVQLDCNLTLGNQISNVVRVSGYHLRNIAFIKKYVDESSIKKLVINSVINRVDYCNSIYFRLPHTLLKKLQNIINRAARLVKGTSPRERITPVLIELHWLPIKARIIFKICVLTHQALRTGCPPYLRELLHVLQPSEGINTRRTLNGVTLFEPRCCMNYGFRTFGSAAPRLYNRLPFDIREIESVTNFKKKLKTHLFSECYDLENLTINTAYAL